MFELGTINLKQKALILVAVPLVFEVFFAALLLSMVERSEKETARAVRSRMVYVYSDTMMRRLYQIGAATLVQSTVGGELFSAECQKASARLDEDLKNLKATVSNDESQRKTVSGIETLLGKILRVLELSRKRNNPDRQDFPLHYDPLDVRAELQPLAQDLIESLEILTEREKAIRKMRPDAEKQAKLLLRVALLAGIGLNIGLALWLAVYFNSSTTKRLAVVLENTNRLSRGESLYTALKGADEIARLDGSFHQMASELQRAQEAQKEAQRVKQEFYQMVSHDLRTPLTTVQFFISVLLKGNYGELSGRGAKAAERSQSALTRLLSMVNSLLDIEKLSSEGFELELCKCRLEDLLRRASESVLGFAEMNKVSLELSIKDDIEFDADPDRIIQVLVNLISNAVKFSEEGQTVRLAGKLEGDRVEISVCDHGRGIPNESRARIFEKFKQVSKEDASEKGGTGLGLPICKMIVEAHGGEIGVESEMAKGSRFWFWIPLSAR